MPRRTHIEMVGKQTVHELGAQRRRLRELLSLLRREWRERQAAEALAEDTAAAGLDDPECCA